MGRLLRPQSAPNKSVAVKSLGLTVQAILNVSLKTKRICDKDENDNLGIFWITGLSVAQNYHGLLK